MARKEIKLEREVKELSADANGIVVEATTIRKGLLNQTTSRIKHDPTGRGWHSLESRGDDEIAVERLVELRARARDVLQAAKLPCDLASPYARLTLEGKLEPLSREECAAKLIQEIDTMLSHDDRVFALHALKLASALHRFIVADGLNEHVMADVEATENRLLGPQTKSSDSLRTREIVMGCARSYWKDHEQFEGNASHTARRIKRDVNSKLAKEKLKELKDKTIADHIRAAK